MRRIIPALLLPFILAVTAHAGAVLKVTKKDSSGKADGSEVYYAQEGMVRIDELDAHGNIDEVNIVRDGVLWQIRPVERTFTRIDAQSLGQTMGDANNRYSAMLASLPPEQRAMIEAQLAKRNQLAATAYTFNDTGKTDHQGGYDCHVFEERRADTARARYCVVPTAGLPAGAELTAAIQKAADTVNQIFASVPNMGHEAERYVWFGKMQGFPVSWYFLASSGAHDDEHVLASAEAQRLPADKFAIPQGFTERPLSRD